MKKKAGADKRPGKPEPEEAGLEFEEVVRKMLSTPPQDRRKRKSKKKENPQ